MFRIGEFSKMSKTTIKTLRYYDEIGLLKPELTDKFTGYRFYSTYQLTALHKIQEYRQIGLSINEILLVLSGQSEKKILEARKNEIISEISERKISLSRIDFILSGQEEENFMNYQATIKQTPECIVYSKRFTLPEYSAYFEIIPSIKEKISKKYPDLKCTKPEYCFNVYLDCEYREKDINIEFCEAVTELKPDFEDIHFKRMPSVTVVSTYHRGSYSNLTYAYTFIYKWIEENQYIAVGGARESYIDGIWNKENEEEWLTEIQVPVVRKSEVSDRYGDTKEFKESESKNYSSEEKKEIDKKSDEILKEFAEVREKAPDSNEAQALVEKWQNFISEHYYKCSKEILSSLGQMYVGDVRFKDNINRFGEGTAEFMSKAIEIYCN